MEISDQLCDDCERPAVKVIAGEAFCEIHLQEWMGTHVEDEKREPMPEDQCKCGCGQLAIGQRGYAQGHWSRGKKKVASPAAPSCNEQIVQHNVPDMQHALEFLKVQRDQLDQAIAVLERYRAN